MSKVKTRDRIIAYLKENPDSGVRKIQRDLKLSSPSIVQHHLKRIEAINITLAEYASRFGNLDMCTPLEIIELISDYLEQQKDRRK